MSRVDELIELGAEKGLFRSGFLETDYFIDEPIHYQFSINGKYNDGTPEIFTGTSFQEDIAKNKTIYEALERICLSEDRKIHKYLNYKLTKTAFPYHDMPDYKVNQSEPLLRCVEGSELIMNGSKDTLIPAQLIFVPYKYKISEARLRSPISTGSSMALSKKESIIRGLLEVIERHDFINSYYYNGAKNSVKYTTSEICTIVKEIQRCGLDIITLDISTIKGVYTFLSICIDKSGFGPAITAGAKSSLNPLSAIQGSIEETIHVRTWLRDLILEGKSGENIDPNKIFNFEDRGLYWSQKKMIKIFCKIYNPDSMAEKEYRKKIYEQSDEENLIKYLLKNDYRIFTYSIKDEISGNWVSKVVVPKMLPLFINEKDNYTKLKKVPHFFL